MDAAPDEPEPELRRADLAADPLDQLRQWFAEAAAVLEVPEAVALATATPDGAPSVRMVLLKGFDERGLVFYSHYTSRKGRELESNPRAALLVLASADWLSFLACAVPLFFLVWSSVGFWA